MKNGKSVYYCANTKLLCSALLWHHRKLQSLLTNCCVSSCHEAGLVSASLIPVEKKTVKPLGLYCGRKCLSAWSRHTSGPMPTKLVRYWPAHLWPSFGKTVWLIDQQVTIILYVLHIVMYWDVITNRPEVVIPINLDWIWGIWSVDIQITTNQMPQVLVKQIP